jgi:hypothetical protein
MRFVVLILFGSFASFSTSPKKTNDLYRLQFEQTLFQAAKGQKGSLKVQLSVNVKDGYVHSQSPFSLNIDAPALELYKSQFRRTEAQVGAKDEKARALEFEVPFTAKLAGEHEVKAKVEFFLCMEKVCRKEAAEASAKVKVL